MLTNPVVISVIVMLALCLLRLNVILSLIVAALVGGLVAGMPIGQAMSVLVGGMSGNAETALSYILLGTLAAAIAKTGAADVLALKLSKVIKGKSIVLLLALAFIAALSGTVVPVHIAFIPILIPPMLILMNKMKLDRRSAACALAFGLKAPYITLPIGYGLIFHNIIRDQMGLSGIEISTNMVWRATWVAGLAMVVGLIAGLIIYRKPREYKMGDHQTAHVDLSSNNQEEVQITGKHYFTLIAGIAALVIQLNSGSMPLGAIGGIAVMLVSKAIKWSDVEDMVHDGIRLMGFIAIVMLVASGFATVMRETGSIQALVEMATGIMGDSKFVAASVMILLGLLITMGIGTSFGTVPVIASIYCPLASALNFSVPAIILLIAVAAALGDAGSPASDTTLGPTAGLDADGQHDHIWDTCVPTFLCYNVPLVVFGIIGAVIL